MQRENFQKIKDIDFDFENRTIRIVLLQELPELEILGQSANSHRKGEEMEVPRWVANEIINQGLAKYCEKEELTIQELSKVHWREALPGARQIPQLEELFYCRLRRFLFNLEGKGKSDIAKFKEYEKALSISNDIVNCRLRKILTLASSPFQTSDLVKNLTLEERSLLESLSKTINYWRKEILEVGENGKYSREP